MAKKQRTSAANFDDIPGELPKGTVPPDVDLSRVAHDAVDKLNSLKQGDLAENAIWRDLLSFTGTYRTFYSRPTVVATLQKLSNAKQRSVFKLKERDPRRAGSLGDIGWVDVDIQFNTEEDGIVGQCEGIVSVIRSEDGEWRIWMLRTWLECLDGHGHPDVLEPSQAPSHNGQNGYSNDQANGLANGHHGHQDLPTVSYDAVVVGGGQAGLSVAGRLKALNVNYILLEKRPEIGHIWATRYDSLRWHTSKEYGCLPFDHTYPAEDDYMLPAKRIGAGHKAYSERFGINLRTSSSVESAVFDDKANVWTISVASPEGHQTLKARNLVLSIGPGHLTPVSPTWATPDRIDASNFRGTITHSSSYFSIPASLAGKAGIVVGTANTGHDVAEDMANAGMSTTMVQRGATFVFPMEWLHHAQDLDYNANSDAGAADKECFTYPNKILRENINRVVWMLIRNSPERFDALEKAGFKLDRYGDIYTNIYSRFGGHYVDIGASARIAQGEIKIKSQAVKCLTEKGLLFEDGSEVPADLIVLCTGFDHNFRTDAAKIVGREVAEQMDDFWGVNGEGEIRGHAKLAGFPHLYYHGGDIRMGRFFSRFIALQIQADALGKPLRLYLD
ncbi:hypothetical protein LTR36_002411 [Oleoguttula mirabilis]|uniref:SnoaL-like domain-containing protein n=1 Tax=Oleoguttula mirabilis TaxID=1507867 RepID=A0AAV9JKV7_9PEZI|nr:hypothetical protein LTR36_002411 [Oleoguttula mirabilis]